MSQPRQRSQVRCLSALPSFWQSDPGPFPGQLCLPPLVSRQQARLPPPPLLMPHCHLAAFLCLPAAACSQQATFMKEALAWLESTSWVERYSWFTVRGD